MAAVARASAPAGGRSGGGTGAGLSAPSPAPGGAAVVAGGPAIRTSSAADRDPRYRRVKDELEKGARRAKTHPAASRKAGQAQAAARPPGNARAAGAKANQVDAMKEAPTPPPEPSGFLAMLRAAIQQIMPKNLDEADKFMKGGEREQVKSAVTGGIAQEKDQAAGAVQSATEQTPDPSGVPDKPVTPIPPEGAPPAPPAVNGADALPAPKPDAQVAAQQQDPKKDADKQLKDADLTPTQLKKANDPRFSAVLTAKGDVEATADAAPGKYRAQEKATLTQAGAAARADTAKGLAGITAARGKAGAGVSAGQRAAKERDEARRKVVVDTIEGIYTQTKASVEAKLADLDTSVSALFDRGMDLALAHMKEYSRVEIDRYKDDRYSGLRGKGRWIADLFRDVPEGIKLILAEARKRFTAEMDVLVVKIADVVESRLRAAKAEIDRGQNRIKAYVDGLPKDLKAVGQSAEKEISGRFEELRQGVDDRANELAQKLAQKYKDAHDKADAALKAIEDANKGALKKLADAVGEVIKILLEFKDKLMALLKKGLDTIKLILADPIGFLSNLLAAIKQGFSQFVSNIWTHLKAGFMAWLFGSLADAGIQLPTDLSLPSILKLVLDILGINYATLRSIAVKHLGERAVKVLEKVGEYIMTLIRGGPAALWEKVKEDLSNLKAMVIDAIQSWLIETVVKQAVIKIVSMFNPAGAIVQALIAIYNTVMFLIERASQIMALVEAVINSVSAIASGAIGSAANWIEQALAKAIPVVIGFLARLLGLSGITDKIRETIAKARAVVYNAMEKAVVKIIEVVKKTIGKVIGALTGKGKEAKEEGKPDQRSDDQKQQDLRRAVDKASRLMDDEDATVDTVKGKLPAIQGEFRLASLELRQDRTGVYHVEAAINPRLSGIAKELWDRLPPEVQAAGDAARGLRAKAVAKANEINMNLQRVASDIEDKAARGVRLSPAQQRLLKVSESIKTVAYAGGGFTVSGYSKGANAAGAATHARLVAVMQRFQRELGELWLQEQQARREGRPDRPFATRVEALFYLPQPDEARDREIEGSFVLAHAEKYAFNEFGGNAFGVSQPMCGDCVDFFSARARKSKSFIVVADPESVKVFLKNKRLTF